MIAICGKFDVERVKLAIKEFGVSARFNVYPESGGEINAYDAVFICNDTTENTAKWVGANCMRLSSTVDGLIDDIKFLFGMGQKLEIERKFLIEMPNLEKLLNEPLCEKAEIEQCYINEPDSSFRVRKRTLKGHTIYIKTEKVKLNEMTHVENESAITKEQYENAVKGNKVLSKTRYLYVFENQYFEIDVFPFWEDAAVMELELKSENAPYTLPPQFEYIEEVTERPQFKNKYIAQKYGTVKE